MTATSTSQRAARSVQPATSSRAAQVRSRVEVEILQYVRRREALFFTFILPPILLVMFASVFGDEIGTTGVSFGQYFLAGIVGSVGLNVGFGSLAGSIAVDRSSGTLHRLGSTPMALSTYILAKLIVLVGSSLAQLLSLLVLGRLVFGFDLPSLAGWVTILWVLTLSVAAFSFWGVAWSTLIRDADSINAVVSPVIIVLPFISGVYFDFADLPSWMQTLGSVFPLRWATLGMRSAFLPDSFRFAEPGGSWQLGMVAAVLLAWTVGAALLGARSFRWGDRDR